MKNALTLITRTDSYKFSQWNQYPSDTAYISSYIEARGGEPISVFFGLQAFIKEYLLTPFTQADIDRAERLITAHGLPFNRKGWEYILENHKGLLPIKIQSVPEGTVMETKNVQVQVINTDPCVPWITSYIETALLRGVWYPSTVATKSRKMKVLIAQALEKSSSVPVADQIGFKLHDFGARGAHSGESAMLGGMGHLVNFMGTDTFEALEGVIQYYNKDTVVGYSIPASEHSTITAWGKDGEIDAYSNMLDLFGGPGKMLACVSDSYDIYSATRDLWGDKLKDQVINMGGTLVVRPDSGDPTTVPIEVVEILSNRFGYTVNSKGYKVLHPSVRVIQGDGINETTLPVILDNLMKAGYSAENITFGMGGGLLAAWNRDTLRYAMKASARKDTNGIWHEIRKNPVTDPGKISKGGRLGLVYQCGLGNCGYNTVPEEVAVSRGNILRTVFENGALLIDESFDEIRQRAELKQVEYEPKNLERY